jgi:APA family basic amino acid/polyamine antiporter
VFASTIPLDDLGEMTSIGTLLAFMIVCAGILILRKRRPDLPRPFRAPFMPVTPILGILISFGLMLGLPLVTWIRLFVWLIIGLVIYFTYGKKHSRVQEGLPPIESA